MKKRIISFIAMLALIMLCEGCIKENLADCNFNLSVEFLEQGSCKNGSVYAEMGKITIFAFNEAGIFSGQFSDDHAVFGTNYKLPVSLPQGKYTLIAWAGNTNTSFKTQNLIKGRTTLNELYMPSYGQLNGTKIASKNPLFTGAVSHVNAIDGTSQVIGLRETSKPLQISFAGLTAAHHYQARISFNAVQYKFDNSLLSLLADDHYTMTALDFSEGQSNHQAQTSLLWPMVEYSPQIMIRDLQTGTDVFKADLKTLLAKLPQVDFDCESSINMNLSISEFNAAQVGIVINGWKVQVTNDEI